MSEWLSKKDLCIRFFDCRAEVSDDEVKLFFGKTFLTVPKSVFEEQPIEIID